MRAAILALCASTLLVGCASNNTVHVPYDSISLHIEHNSDAPFRIDGVSRNLTAEETISFLTFLCKTMGPTHRCPPIVVWTETKAGMPGEYDVWAALSGLSRAFEFTVYTMPLPHGRAPEPLMYVEDKWIVHEESNIKLRALSRKLTEQQRLAAERIKATILPSVELKDATMKEALNAVQRLSNLPRATGDSQLPSIRIVYTTPTQEDLDTPTVTLVAKQISLAQCLDILSDISHGMQWAIDDETVLFGLPSNMPDSVVYIGE